MTDFFAGRISEADVRWASMIMGLGEDGFAPVDGDDSRLKAMLNLETADYEACPGSGKTTLLVAKLAVLASRWSDRHRGICVLSHTNAARDEIGTRLNHSAAGVALLRHPHFVGTIHSFVNEFLAIPWLRSKGNDIRCIDTQIALRHRWGLLDTGARWAMNKARLPLTALAYDAPDFSGGKKGKFGPHTPTYQKLVAASRMSSEQGFFCFDEMFVWANELLDRCPGVAADLRQRFPLLFVDEAQDNSEIQSALLHRIFRAGDNPVRRQRFGDSNQAIYAYAEQEEDAASDKFPAAPVHDIPRSHRFSQALANEVKGFGVNPQDLIGAGPSKTHIAGPHLAPVIFLFDEASITEVLPRFAAHLTANFDEVALAEGVFTAVAGVHDLDEDGKVPHAIGHYAPNYDAGCARREAAPSSFAQYLTKASFEAAGSSDSHRMVHASASALLAASELSGGTHRGFARRSPHKRVLDALGEHPARADYLKLLDFILSARGTIDDAGWKSSGVALAQSVVRTLCGATTLSNDTAKFLLWPDAILLPADLDPGLAKTDNLFLYPGDAPKLKVRLGSIHSVKGETHTATLVLESFYYRHHLSELKPWILGLKSGGSRTTARGKVIEEGARMLGRLRLHYVAMTRPTHLLCLAMRRDSFDGSELDILASRGWHVVDCAVPASA